MTDITNLFRAKVKAVKTTNKVTGSHTEIDSEILTHRRKLGDFELKSKKLVSSISELREFLFTHRKEYVNADSHLSDVSGMTDIERDQIDSDAQKVIKTCRETIKLLHNEESQQKVMPHAKEHRDIVMDIIQKYLRAVCKIYSEQKAVRVKRIVDRKRYSRLEPERRPHVRNNLDELRTSNATSLDANSKKVSLSQSDRNPNNTTSRSKSKSDHPIEEHSSPLHVGYDDADELTTEDAQMFENENAALFDEMNSMVNEVRQIEGKVIEISRLQEIFSEKIMEQDVDIDRIGATTVQSTENIKDANEQIRDAMKKNAGFRVWILFFLIVCTLSLLFLDWYNS